MIIYNNIYCKFIIIMLKTFEQYTKEPIVISKETLEYVYKIIDNEENIKESIYDDYQKDIDTFKSTIKISMKIMDTMIKYLMLKLSKKGITIKPIDTKKDNILLYKTNKKMDISTLLEIEIYMKDLYSKDELNIYDYNYKIITRKNKNYFLFQF